MQKRTTPFGTFLLAVVALFSRATHAENLPPRLLGSWRITKILPTRNVACWDEVRARQLVGSTLTYRAHSMHWQGGDVPLQNAFTREVTADEFLRDSGHGEYYATFAQIGIKASSVIEVDLQHEDAEITGATTEVPGDSILLAGPDRIVVSACGVFYEARRSAARDKAIGGVPRP